VGNARIEIDAVALVDDVLLVAVEKFHRSLDHEEDLLPLVLVEGPLFRLDGEGEEEGLHGLVREPVSHGLVGIPEGRSVPGDQGPLVFSHKAKGGAGGLLAEEGRDGDAEGAGNDSEGGNGGGLFRFFDFREISLGEARPLGEPFEGDLLLRPEGLDPFADFGLDDSRILFHFRVLSWLFKRRYLFNSLI